MLPQDRTPIVYAFRDVEIDPTASCVRRGGEMQYLRPKTFQVLMVLVARRDQVVTKEELLQAVWPGTAVTDDTLVQSIGDIRKAVGDDPRESWFIRTIPRVGYRLVAALGDAEPTPEIEAAPVSVRRAPNRLLLVLALAGVTLLASGIAWSVRRSSAPTVKASGDGAPARRDHMTDNLEAYEAYTQGVAAANGLENTTAIAHFQRAIALDPGFAMAYARIGYVYAVRSSLREQAPPYLAQALARGDRLSERERLYVLAWQAIATHEYGKAIDHFRLLVTRYPTDLEAFEGLGRLLLGEERMGEAIDVYRQGLVVDPDSASLNNAMGSAASYLGRHAEAIAHHKRYVALNPSVPNAHDSLGLSYQRSGDYEKAIAAYDEALRLNPRFEIALAHRANTLWQTGRIREAIRDFEHYIVIASSARDRSRGYGELSHVYRSVGDLERAAANARRSVEEDDDAVINEIALAVERGDAATARRLVDSMQTPSITNRGARYAARLQYAVRAEVARVEGDAPRAIELAREAVRRQPMPYLIDDREDVLADTLAAFGRHPEAIDEYRRILHINAHRGRTIFKLARSLDAAGRHTEARSEYERFLTEWQHADAGLPEELVSRRRLESLRQGQAQWH